MMTDSALHYLRRTLAPGLERPVAGRRKWKPWGNRSAVQLSSWVHSG
jgi:hypothetical protein